MINKTWYVTLGVLLSVSGCSKINNNAPQNPCQLLKTWQQTYGVTAASLTIYPDNNQIQTCTDGRLNKDSNRPLAQNSLFRMNSITKSFTAALALRLVDSGKIKLDANIVNYLPQYPAWNNVTIRELLNQTSGIFDYIESPGWFENLAKNPDKNWTPTQLAQLAYKHPSYFAPGQGWSYSNTNYVLLGMIIEHVTKQSMAENLQIQFFTPMHLSHTFYVPERVPSNVLEQLVHGYFQGNDATYEDPSVWQAAAGIISNTHDMAIWFHDLMTGKVLSKRSFKLMETLVSTKDGTPVQMRQVVGIAYGMGVFYTNAPRSLWFVPGISSGYRSLVVYEPTQKMTYALAVNAGLPNQPHFVNQTLISLANIE